MKDIDENEIDTILAEDIDFQGVISFDKDLMIKGKVTGEIQATGNLFVDKNAEVNAKIEADVVTSKGHIVGDIYANNKVALYSTAVIEGNVSTPEIEIESGAKINGHCNMRQDGPEENDNPESVENSYEDQNTELPVEDRQVKIEEPRQESYKINESQENQNNYQSWRQNVDSENGDKKYE